MSSSKKIAGKKDCDLVIAELFGYLDNEMNDQGRAFVDAHLAGCPGCHARAEFEKALRSKVRQLASSKAPRSLRERVLAQHKKRGK